MEQTVPHVPHRSSGWPGRGAPAGPGQGLSNRPGCGTGTRQLPERLMEPQQVSGEGAALPVPGPEGLWVGLGCPTGNGSLWEQQGIPGGLFQSWWQLWCWPWGQAWQGTGTPGHPRAHPHLLPSPRALTREQLFTAFPAPQCTAQPQHFPEAAMGFSQSPPRRLLAAQRSPQDGSEGAQGAGALLLWERLGQLGPLCLKKAWERP